MSRDFWPNSIWLRRFDLGPMCSGKHGVAKFFVFAKILKKIREKTCVCIVVDYADTCQHSRWLHKYRVGVVNDYADTDKTTRTLSENFEGFSQILKEQSGKKCYFGAFTHPIAIIKNLQISKSNEKITIEYLHENKKVRETVLACLYCIGPRSNLLSKKMDENLVTLSL